MVDWLLHFVDLCAALVFSITGALVASRKQMDIVGFAWLGVITGVGGGTVRDLLLDAPVFWVENPAPVIVCLVGAIGVYFLAHLVQSRYTLILWLDAAGLALVTIAGTAKGLAAGAGPVVAVAMGIVTGSLGGIIRDLLGGEPSIILRREIYVTASLGGAMVYVLLTGLTQHPVAATVAGFLVVFIIRGLAITWNWSLPTYRARPGRDVDKTD